MLPYLTLVLCCLLSWNCASFLTETRRCLFWMPMCEFADGKRLKTSQNFFHSPFQLEMPYTVTENPIHYKMGFLPLMQGLWVKLFSLQNKEIWDLNAINIFLVGLALQINLWACAKVCWPLIRQELGLIEWYGEEIMAGKRIARTVAKGHF